MAATHFIFEIEDIGEFHVAPIPTVNGVSLHERVHFFGSKRDCEKMVKVLKKKRKK